MMEPEEEELIRRCLEGEEGAWSRFVERHTSYLSASLRRILFSLPSPLSGQVSVEDALQDCFAALLENEGKLLRKYDGRVPLCSYLRMVAVRRLHNRLRSHRRFLRSVSSERLFSESFSVDSSSETERKEEIARLDTALSRLPPRDRLLLRLVRGEGVTYREAARMLGIPADSVGFHLARAQKTLHKYLRDHPGV